MRPRFVKGAVVEFTRVVSGYTDVDPQVILLDQLSDWLQEQYSNDADLEISHVAFSSDVGDEDGTTTYRMGVTVRSLWDGIGPAEYWDGPGGTEEVYLVRCPECEHLVPECECVE